MFKFGFDLSAEGDGGAGTDAQQQQEQQEQQAPQDVSGEAHSASAGSNKPQLSVLDMSDAITSVFESDTLFEYVPLLDGGGSDGTAAADADAAADASSSTATPRAQPLRRVVFPPDQKVPPSLSGDAALNRESLADTDLIPGVYEGGLKVWECSLDLCRHLAEEMVRLEDINAANGNIDEGENDDDHP